MQHSRGDTSLGELFGELTRQLTTLVRQELVLARTEMTHKAARVGKDIAFLAVGGAVLYAGGLALLAAVSLLLIEVVRWPWWLSALLVGLVVAGVGYFLVQRGRAALTREDLAPRETVEEINESAEWAKEQKR